MMSCEPKRVNTNALYLCLGMVSGGMSTLIFAVSYCWQDAGRTLAGQNRRWQDAGRTLAGRWQDTHVWVGNQPNVCWLCYSRQTPVRKTFACIS